MSEPAAPPGGDHVPVGGPGPQDVAPVNYPAYPSSAEGAVAHQASPADVSWPAPPAGIAYPAGTGYPYPAYPAPYAAAPGSDGYPAYPGYLYPQGYPAGYGIGGHPGRYPAAPPAEEPPPRPSVVRASGWLWVAAGVLYGLGWVLAVFLDAPFMAADMAASDPEPATSGDALPVAAIVLVIAALGALLAAAVHVVIGVQLWSRRTWARAVLAVLGGVMLLVVLLDVLIGWAWRSGLTVLPDGDPSPWTGYAVLASLSAAQFVVTVAAIVTMFLPLSNHYFAGGRRG
ncbi:MAG TPA: hypothetical protein VGD67_06745 [Pseudonocardiaceae bacterium]